MTRGTWWCLPVMGVFALAACGDDEETTGPGPATTGATTGGGGATTTGAGGTTQGTTTGTGGASAGGGGAGGSDPIVCDYQVEGGLLVIEAEDLPLSDDWIVETAAGGFTGSGYIAWTGASQNNNPGQGLIAVDVYIPEAGRYRWRWRNRIGLGTNTTEHNDTWLRWPTLPVEDYYGMNDPGNESRRYPRPTCEDAGLMQTIESDPAVVTATCPNGTSSDGWMKIYSSGASDWSWSTRTSDNDAHDIFIEVQEPGVVRLEISARGDFHLIDRMVLSAEGVENGVAQDTGAPPTPCD